MGTLWLGGQRGWFARNFTQITGADTGFPEGGGVKTFHKHPPLDIVCVTSSALRKIEKHPHSWTLSAWRHHKHPPWTLPVWRHPHSKGGGGVIGPGHEHFAIGFQYRDKFKGGGVIIPVTPPGSHWIKKNQPKNRSRVKLRSISAHWIAC